MAGKRKPAKRAAAGKRQAATNTRLPKHVALVLQGGGALGAYQGGVYEQLDEGGIAPSWIAGISIGAFNAAIIAGNTPDRRVAALREFWETISQPFAMPATPTLGHVPFPQLADQARAWLETFDAWRALTEGQRGFYQPRSWFGSNPFLATGPAQSSFYDTSPMLETLERLVDFDLLNDGDVRVSVGAVDVGSGELVYFDNQRMRLDARHFLASGALPPGFPAVEIDGRFYWDGGLVSNTPLAYVLDQDPRCDSLVFQVDLWRGQGALPETMFDVFEREKEIRYASRTRRVTEAEGRERHFRRLLRELLEEMPEKLRETNPWCQHAAQLAEDARTSVIQLTYNDRAEIGHFKDYQFGDAAMREHWAAGSTDAARALAHPEWLQLPDGNATFVTHNASARPVD